ncbi:MAG TPA: DEAD/DEAH box helicase [Phycisphaerales bacterium]|nr:DEAD/DEAH box helicase [Phycisphaerales bacterium]
MTRGTARVLAWFADQGWTPFEFQRAAWEAFARGESGLINAPTGVGKTLAALGGPLATWMDAPDPGPPGAGPGGTGGEVRPEVAPEPVRGTAGERARRGRAQTAPLYLLWLTPMRALANDSAQSIAHAVKGLGLGARWSVETRTGDTSATLRARQKERLPTCLLTTPESLSLLLSYPDARERLASVRAVVVDEWHELMGTKRGTQTELALARLRAFAPGLRVWGLSATLGNLGQAMDVLMGRPGIGTLVRGVVPKDVRVETVLPDDIQRFPWAGHLGLKLLDKVLAAIEGRLDLATGAVTPAEAVADGTAAATGASAPAPRSTLLFTNTRSQAENWFRAIVTSRPEWVKAGAVAIHHGSLDRGLRERVEDRLRAGQAKVVVCTSSLDLGVDFSPVDQVIQVGSPKGVARLLQRAGRSGHRPGAPSRVTCVPTHALELIEFAAAREAIARGEMEAREPLARPLDVLVQHLVTVAAGGGFRAGELLEEVRGTYAYRDLSQEQWSWCVDFVVRGGPALTAYPRYCRVAPALVRAAPPAVAAGQGPCPPAPALPSEAGDGNGPLYTVASPAIARLHRFSIGTITSATSMVVKLGTRTLGTIEESFIGRLAPGDKFVFAGRFLELVRVRGLIASARKAKGPGGAVPTWDGGKMPLSTQLADAVRRRMDEARDDVYASPEMRSVRPLLEVQRRWSHLPGPGELLIERVRTRDGRHLYLFPFEGRLVHEGLAALLAYRLAARRPMSVTSTANDYGMELLLAARAPEDEWEIDPFTLDEAGWRRVLSTERLVEDLLECLGATRLARRRFRDIARIAGLVVQGFPGAPRPVRHLQASSELFFDVFTQFDPENMLLDQARREVLQEQLEVRRMVRALERIAGWKIVIFDPPQISPLAFPVFADRLRENHVSTEKWADRVAKMVLRLEAEADRAPAGVPRPARSRRRPGVARGAVPGPPAPDAGS